MAVLAESDFNCPLHTAAERTVEAIWTTCGKLLDRFPEHECHHHLRQFGYRYTQT
jgi:hypothetical protein